MQKFWEQFRQWGFTPKLLAIPGNHDLVRPPKSDPSLLNLLHNWKLSEVQTAFWDNPESAQQQVITNAFQNYTDWWENTSIPKLTTLNNGLLPGDCSGSLEINGLKFGFVGLNTAYLQLAGGDFNNKLHLDIRQLNAVCNEHAADWVKQYDAFFLRTILSNG